LARTKGDYGGRSHEKEKRRSGDAFRLVTRSGLRTGGTNTSSTGRIGVKPLQTNALLLAQKKNGAAVINEKSLKHFSPTPQIPKRDPSPSKGSTSSGGKGKEKTSAKNSDEEDDEDGDSGDEAEKLDDKQLNEIDSIYRKWVVLDDT
jgi:hypothetical protein